MAVNTVFGRSGDVVALQGDYATFYAPNGAHLPAGGLTQQVLTKVSGANFDTAWTNATGGVSSDVVAGSVLLSVAPVDPNNPIAFGQNDPVVELTTNKITSLGTPTDTQYPSALLVKTQLDTKVNKLVALTPATKTKLTYNADGLITAGADATTADIADSTNKRYVTDSHITNLGNLSGTNTGDQNLSGYATTGALATTNANVAAISSSLTGYATTAALATTNSNVSALSASLSGYATTASLATTDANVAALSTNLTTNYTLQVDHNTLQTQVNGLSSAITGTGIIIAPAVIKLTDTGTNSTPNILYLDHDLSSGTAAAGLGVKLEFRGRSSTTASQTQATVRTEWTDATHATRSARMVFSKVLSGTLSDIMWLRSDGSLAVGTNLGGGFGTIWAGSGFQTSGGSIAGQVLRFDTGANAFVASLLQTTDLSGQFESCSATKITTTDQTSTAETTHLTATVTAAGMTLGATFKVVVWGNIDNGTTAILFTPRLRWGVGGTILSNTPTIQGTTTGLTNKSWKLEYLVTITSAGGTGTARVSSIKWDHTTLTTGLITVDCTDSGATDITSINTTVDTTINFTWEMSATTGTPHVRTLGGTMEVVKR